MGWEVNLCRSPKNRTQIRLAGVEGRVTAELYAGPPHGYVPIVLEGESHVTLAHFAQLEVFEPDPLAKRFEETLYYQETSTGALYKRQRADNQLDDHFICIGAMKPSRTVLAGDIPVGFKRLHKEA